MLHKGKPPEGVTLEGARRHAQLIAAYWAKRGFDVIPRIEEVAPGKPHGMGTIWGIRSNMVCGMPQRGAVMKHESIEAICATICVVAFFAFLVLVSH